MLHALLQTPLMPDGLRLLERIAHFQGAWRAVTSANRDFYAALQKNTIVTSAGASTRIEGATLSDEDILQRLDGLKIKAIRDRDEAEVAGYIDCKKYIFDEYARLEISEHTIRSLHQMMMAYLPETLFPLTQRGVYKNIPNSVVRIDQATGAQEIIFATTPPGAQTEMAMRALVDAYRAFILDPNYARLEVIAAFIVAFLAIHPFRDGNGRISRLLTDLCLLQCGYDFCVYASHEKVIEESKVQYYVALRQTQATLATTPDLNPWLLYFLKVLDAQTCYAQEQSPPKKSGTLTDREQRVYELIRQHQPVTIGFLERESGIKRVTLKTILARLKIRGVLAMEGTRKSSRYVISGDRS